jgi:hypothetical protein
MNLSGYYERSFSQFAFVNYLRGFFWPSQSSLDSSSDIVDCVRNQPLMNSQTPLLVHGDGDAFLTLVN